MSSATQVITAPTPPRLTARDLVAQFWRDIYGKEVQTASTYSYTWVADQVGHVCIGILASFVFTKLVDYVLPMSGFASATAGAILAAIAASLWEYSAYRTDVAKAANGQFPLGTKLLGHNAAIAAGYMILGAAVGWVLHQANWPWWALAVLVVLAVVLAPWWLRQKITWQKAGMPFLARLADLSAIGVQVPQAAAGELWTIIQAGAPPLVQPRVAVIAGPVGSGRTSVACGIGTEFAFGHASVRYLSFDDLIEFAATSDFETDPPLPGPANIGFWPWSRAQVLIIDNVGPIIAASDMVHKAGRDGALSAWLADRLPNIREALRSRHTIWILGEIGSGSADQLQRSADEIGRFLGVADPLAILMQPSRTAQPQPVTWVQRALRFLAGLAGQRFPSPAVAAPVGPRPVRRDSD